jgi:hypothetical protein
MKCNDFEACMPDLLNGTLAKLEHREALEHALACHECELVLYEQQRLDLELRTLAVGEWLGAAPPELEQRLTVAFREHSKVVDVSSLGPLALLLRIFAGDRKWKYATAVVSLALCIFATWNWFKRPQPYRVEIVSVNQNMESVKPISANPAPGITTVVSGKLPVIHRLRPQPRLSSMTPRVEWVTAEVATDFYAIPYVESFRPNDRVRIVRIQVPYSTLADYGLPVYSDQALHPVQADVMVGDDNVARSIRFIQQWRLPRERSHPVIKKAVN